MRWSATFFAVVCYIVSQPGCVSSDRPEIVRELSITDDLGREARFRTSPQRIVSLAPSITETLFALDSGHTLIARTNFCNFPPEAAAKQSVGDIIQPNLELLTRLAPDVVIVTVEGNTREDVEKIESLGITTFATNPKSIEGVFKTIRDIGAITRHEARAESLVINLHTRRTAVHARVEGAVAPRVLVIISLQPLITAGPQTFIDQMVREAGGMNIAHDAPVSYPILSREEIIRRQPECIILPDDATSDPAVVTTYYPEWRQLPAVRNGRVYLISADLLMRPGPRVIDALELLASLLHPES